MQKRGTERPADCAPHVGLLPPESRTAASMVRAVVVRGPSVRLRLGVRAQGTLAVARRQEAARSGAWGGAPEMNAELVVLSCPIRHHGPKHATSGPPIPSTG